MKRIGVAAIITTNGMGPRKLLLGKRAKDPNRGKFVVPGGGVKDNETLEKALAREVREETGLEIADDAERWTQVYISELDDRLILFVTATVRLGTTSIPVSESDLDDVAWFSITDLPLNISPVVRPALENYGFKLRE